MRIGITGHIRLSGSSAHLIYASLVRRLLGFRSVHGVTCLAPGADQLFAAAVQRVGGSFEVVLPAPGYLSSLRLTGAARDRVRRLLKQARPVRRLPSAEPPAAYAAASAEVLRRCDLLFAVWDGSRIGEPGSTAHTVAHAARMGIPTTIIWPAGASRT